MYTVYIHNNESNRLERYKLKPYHDMPYTYANALSVSDFFAATHSLVGWTSTHFLKSWTSFSKGHCRSNYFFRRICEGGHTQQSMHYAGLAAQLSENVKSDFPFQCNNHIAMFPCGYPSLSQGDIGPFVFVIQDALLTLGFDSCSLDGFLGNHTKNALLAFKLSQGLSSPLLCDKPVIDRLTFLSAGVGIGDTIKYVKKYL